MKYKEIDIVYKDCGCNFKIVKDREANEYVIYDDKDEEIGRSVDFEVAYNEVDKLRQKI